ncbi:MAG: hypothetical protein ABSF22_13370 [Bryobacteraceae bacterium]|jgi:hypothetical protein
MDHLEAEQMKGVERYMLGDLTVSEVEELERHFFDCPQCSEELRALTIFQENARAVFAEQDPAPIPASVTVPKSTASASWWSGFSPLWFSSAMALAGLLIGIFSGYLAFASRENVQAVSAYPLYAQARGEETVVSPTAGSKFYTLYLDRTWEGDFASYRAVLRDASGTEQFAVPVKSGAAGDAIHVLVPTHKLAAGKYVLVMLGGETELARFPFTLRFQ